VSMKGLSDIFSNVILIVNTVFMIGLLDLSTIPY
jgi:hypothetical protein